nr:chromodomain-helicase-DNA-binding protein Mi-2 isogeny [Tanacetum cinerariifolium]
SKLKRLNFKGFYTVILEKDNELISAATVRVFGEKVAELPLVGTRIKYRRRGMGHILMNELEKHNVSQTLDKGCTFYKPTHIKSRMSQIMWTLNYGNKTLFSNATNERKSQLLGGK